MKPPKILRHPDTGVEKTVVGWAIELDCQPLTIFKRVAKGRPWWVKKKTLGDRRIIHPDTQEVKTIAEWGKHFGLPLDTIRARIRRWENGSARHQWWDMDQTPGPLKKRSGV